MTLATLFNLPTEDRGMAQFAFANASHHAVIAQAIQKLYNSSAPVYILDPIPVLSPGVWLYNHQTVHNFQNSVLGIAGNDLTGIDWKQPDEVASWIAIHAEEHRQAAIRLGI